MKGKPKELGITYMIAIARTNPKNFWNIRKSGRWACPRSHMAKKWTNENLPGVLHYVTGNVDKRRRIFVDEAHCIAFLEELQSMKQKREARLVCFVVMPDHFHFIVNPRDGDIQSWTRELEKARR